MSDLGEKSSDPFGDGSERTDVPVLRYNRPMDTAASTGTPYYAQSSCHDYFGNVRLPLGKTPHLNKTAGRSDTVDRGDFWTQQKRGKVVFRRIYSIFLFGVTMGVALTALTAVRRYMAIPKTKYCAVIDEDFSRGIIDPTIFAHEKQVGGFGNHEFEWTTDSTNNSWVEDGILYIAPTLTSDFVGVDAITNGGLLNLTADGTCTAANKSSTIDCQAVSNSTKGVVLPPVQSARLNTRGLKQIRYGRLEIKARMPKGDWIWPAIWMMPLEETYGAWPRSGEIDIVESKGNAVTKRQDDNANLIHSTLHWGSNQGVDRYWKSTSTFRLWRKFWNEEFYTFGMDWDEEGIRTWAMRPSLEIMNFKFPKAGFYDFAEYPQHTDNGTVVDNPWAGKAYNAPFDTPFTLILSVAVGGTTGFFPDNDIKKPWSNSDDKPALDFWLRKDEWWPSWPSDKRQRALAIDYVRMYQKC